MGHIVVLRNFRRSILIISISVLLFNCLWNTKVQRIPAWVPVEAIDSAQVYLRRASGYFEQQAKKIYSDEEIQKIDKSQLYLKYAWENVCVDYIEYSEGDRIQDHFYCLDKTGSTLMRVGFGVYYKEKQLGTIDVSFKSDSTWAWTGTGVNGIDHEDYLAVVFKAYPESEGYKVYKHGGGFYYFPEKDGEIIEIMQCGYSGREVVTYIHDPLLFIAKEKKRAIEFHEWEQVMKDYNQK